MENSLTTQAWTLIELYNLNEKVRVGENKVPRFCLIDAAQERAKTPESAAAVYDMVLGKAFLPQSDSDWLEQLVTRFQLSLQFNRLRQEWVSYAGEMGNPSVEGAGPTPGTAVVAALITAARNGVAPAKQAWA